MCYDKSFVVTQGESGLPARIWWYKENSHSEIFRRLGLPDGDNHIAPAVKLECLPPYKVVTVDQDVVPQWYTDQQEEIEARVIILAKIIAALRDEYDAKRQALRDEYDAKISAIEGYLPDLA